jgi:tripartite-type tricarboxylate transporter receptor subunit TctC
MRVAIGLWLQCVCNVMNWRIHKSMRYGDHIENRLYRVLAYALLAIAASLAAPVPLSAQQYPAKPVKIIVAFPPGGGHDLIARVMAQRLTTAFGQQFIVENKPGAGGSIGFRSGIKAAADGYTLTLISSSYAVNPSSYKLDYDPVADIASVIEISQGPMLVVVHPSLAVRNLAELIALAKSKPGQINFATAGQGTGTHLSTVLFASMAGIEITVVNYKGVGPALTDTIGGQTDAMITTTAAALPYVKAGRLRALAVTAPRAFRRAGHSYSNRSRLAGLRSGVLVRPGRPQGTAASNRRPPQRRSDKGVEAEGNGGATSKRRPVACRWQP